MIMLGIGAILLLIAGTVAVQGFWFRSNAVKVTGTVVEEVLTAYADGNAYCPLIRYNTREGRTYEHQSNICAWPPAYEEGQHITVYYDRANPKTVQLDSLFANWFFPLLFGFLGVVFSFSGASMLSGGWLFDNLIERYRDQTSG